MELLIMIAAPVVLIVGTGVLVRLVAGPKPRKPVADAEFDSFVKEMLEGDRP
ncbi:hypothetical protein ACFVAJ_17950 [Agromyces sp. NPDC057679]|uniref:hypothetical protein n=1 Tax=Agromyces sp. NPDC057679 TaxID=3346207 RepID=UPI00366B7766